jgi:hypothetical protein
MLQLTPQSRIFLATEPVDFRKGIDGLSAVCRQVLHEQPLSGAVFVFRNRSATALKLLFYDGQGYWLSSKRQNTSMSASPAGQVTIIDPSHPLYGRMLPLSRPPSKRSKAHLLVQLPDGRVQRLPREVTDQEASASVPHPQALITVPTLLPLVHLICAMLSGKEDVCHDTAQSLTIEVPMATGYDPLLDNEPELARTMAASVKQRVAFGERAGEKVRRLGSGCGYEGERPERPGPRCASVHGFSLHANTAMPAHRRDQLERLRRYTARGALSLERLEQDANGDLSYRFTRPWSDGTTGIKLSPLELLEKLAALVPLPRAHLVRYSGCLAPHSKLRSAIIPTYFIPLCSTPPAN